MARMVALAPGFLIASPPLGDPNFERTVVLLVLHGDHGALGFVVNRVAPLSLGEVLGFAGYGPRIGATEGSVFVGGPVEPGSGWVLSKHGGEIPPEGALSVSDQVWISSSRAAFDDLARDLEPDPTDGSSRGIGRRMVLLGYAGWGPGQLEGEIAEGAWLPTPFDETVLFDVSIERKWESAHALIGVSPAMGIGMRIVGEA